MLSVLVMSYPFLADRANLGAGQLPDQGSQDLLKGLTPRPILYPSRHILRRGSQPIFTLQHIHVGFRFRYTGNLHGVLPTLLPALNRFGNAVPDIFNRGTVRAHHSRNGLRHRRFRCGSYLFIIGDGLSC